MSIVVIFVRQESVVVVLKVFVAIVGVNNNKHESCEEKDPEFEEQKTGE